MAMYDNTNRGVLFKNDRKEKDTDPDYKGTANTDGVEYWLNAWINESQKDGRKYMALRFTIKEQQPPRDRGGEPERKKPDFDDSIPF